MINHDTERQHPSVMYFMITPKHNDRKIHLPRSRCVMSHSCERNPRYTGYRCKGIRTIRLGFNSLNILVLLHIPADIFIKYSKILIPLCPDIRKCLIIFVKNRIRRMAYIIYAQLTIFVHSHSEILMMVDLIHNGIHHRRIKMNPLFPAAFPQLRHIQFHIHLITGANLFAIISIMLPPRPLFHVYTFKCHFCSSC